LELAPCLESKPGFPDGTCNQSGDEQEDNRAKLNAAKLTVAKELAQDLDSEPWEGDFNICSEDKDADPLRPGVQCDKDAGRTKNDTWGGYLKGDIVLPWGMQLTSITGFDAYDRFIDIDLDFSPQTLFHITTEDDGWQVAQDLRLRGQLGDESSLRWDIGGWFLREQLDVAVANDLGKFSDFGVGRREYTQDLWSAAGYASLAFDFWDDFSLDGGFRYNWEQKKLDFGLTYERIPDPFVQKLNETWDAPTGTVRLTYRFREDTHVFWKYTRGWKPGTYNATSSVTRDFSTGVNFANVSTARPETIDSFETGVRGSWFEGRLGLDFSFFYYSYSDYQIFTAQQFEGGQPEFVILNADDAEVYGAEIDAVARPWIGAFVNVRFGWLESQFLDFVQLQQERVLLGNQRITVNREIQNTGNNLLNSPRYKVSLTAEQTLPLGRWGSLTARYDGVWTDTTYYDATQGRGIPNVQNVQFMPEETIAQPDFWLHNVRLSYRSPDGRFELAGWVRNIADEAYKTFAFDGSTFNNTSIYFVGDPRTYGGTLIVNF
jgi:iron complex outermembrane receptor protein